MDWQKEDLKYIWHPCSQMNFSTNRFSDEGL